MTGLRFLLSRGVDPATNYESAVLRAGGIPLTHYCPDADCEADALILCGGGDIDPPLLGEENAGSREIDRARDEAEFALIHAFLQKGRPILGICRGHQVLQVALGGTLLQDIGEALGSFHHTGHHSTETGDRVHPIATAEGSALRQIWGRLPLVNSAHHQAICTPAPGFLLTAHSEGGVNEAAEHSNLPLFGVQFHPERFPSHCADGDALFHFFVARCLACKSASERSHAL